MLAGDLIANRYRLIRRLGHGGMGDVWAARNEAIARDVAIKVMLPRIAEDPVALQRFFNEAKICGSIRHPGIVDVIDLGKAEDGSPFLVMELLEGETLGDRMHRNRRTPPALILPIVRDIARTIAMAHKRGIIHRDIKPNNIFLHRTTTGQEIVKVLDFGISKVLAPEFETKTTHTGAVLGSPAYMSPERAKGDDLKPQVDVYSLGVVLYEALAGRLPYLSEHYNALIIDIVTTDPDDIASLVPDLPASVAALVRDAMARDLSRRIPSMDDFADRIDQILYGLQAGDPRFSLPERASGSFGGGRPSGPGSSSPSLVRTGSGITTSSDPGIEPSRRRRSLVIGGLGVGMGVVIGAIVLMTRGPSGPPETSQTAAATGPEEPPQAPTATSTASPTANPTTSASALVESPSARATSSGAAASKPPAVKAPATTNTTKSTGKKAPGGAWGYD